MAAPRLLRFAGAVDILAGGIALVAAEWLGDQAGVGTTAVRVAAAVLVVIGVDTIWLADRRWMARATVAVEAIAALLAIDLAVVGGPTGTGTALLLATAAYCAAVAIEVALVSRARSGSLVPA